MMGTNETPPSRQDWDAEHIVDASQAEDLIARQFPDLGPVTARPLGEGFDNTAFVVNDQWVFRFPRRTIAVSLLASEMQLLPLIARHVPIPVPVPTHSGEPADDYPWPFAGYRLMTGTTACRAALSPEQRQAIAEPLGRFLAALHALPPTEATCHGAGPDTLRRMDVPLRLQKRLETWQQLAEKGLLADPDATRQAMHQLASPLPGPRPTVLVHGDLYARHLIVDDGGGLAGVIDWGDVHLGDPALDLAIAPYFLPPTAWATFRQAYGPISDETWQLARFRTLLHALLLLNYAAETGDADLMREARLGHDQVLQSL
jgi:aminoglycoside phosphotransferase (APT) family kinase protein